MVEEIKSVVRNGRIWVEKGFIDSAPPATVLTELQGTPTSKPPLLTKVLLKS
jgi:hypothetical protein